MHFDGFYIYGATSVAVSSTGTVRIINQDVSSGSRLDTTESDGAFDSRGIRIVVTPIGAEDSIRKISNIKLTQSNGSPFHTIPRDY